MSKSVVKNKSEKPLWVLVCFHVFGITLSESKEMFAITFSVSDLYHQNK